MNGSEHTHTRGWDDIENWWKGDCSLSISNLYPFIVYQDFFFCNIQKILEKWKKKNIPPPPPREL